MVQPRLKLLLRRKVHKVTLKSKTSLDMSFISPSYCMTLTTLLAESLLRFYSTYKEIPRCS